MTLRTKESMGTLAIHGSAIEQSQHTAHFVIEFLGSVFTFLYEFFIRQ